MSRLADGLAVVEGLKHREQAAVFLYEPRERVQIARSSSASEGFPRAEQRGRRPLRHVSWSPAYLASSSPVAE